MSFVIFSAIVFNLGSLPLLFPVLWTWGLKTNTVGDAFTAIQFMFSGWNLAYVIFPWLGFASFLIVGVLIGKSLCGWLNFSMEDRESERVLGTLGRMNGRCLSHI